MRNVETMQYEKWCRDAESSDLIFALGSLIKGYLEAKQNTKISLALMALHGSKDFVPAIAVFKEKIRISEKEILRRLEGAPIPLSPPIKENKESILNCL